MICYVVMGVAGAGKSRIGAALASGLGLEFVEGDTYHAPANVKHMEAGIPLTDDDRAEWLRSIALRIREAASRGAGLVVTCSALKRAYRDVLRSAANDVQFIYLRGPRELIAERLANRRGHFMPVSLLDSQFAILDEPSHDEHAWVCDVTQSPEEIVAGLIARVTI
ncbi:MAG: gluconokinase [Gemmatimonadaceae bacterium]